MDQWQIEQNVALRGNGKSWVGKIFPNSRWILIMFTGWKIVQDNGGLCQVIGGLFSFLFIELRLYKAKLNGGLNGGGVSRK